MSTWEERMSQRSGGMNAQERARRTAASRVPFYASAYQRRMREEYEQHKRDDGFVLVGGTEIQTAAGPRIIGGKWFKPEPEKGPDYCRECCTWDTEEGIYKVNCFEGGYEGLQCRFGHDHHKGEVWLA